MSAQGNTKQVKLPLWHQLFQAIDEEAKLEAAQKPNADEKAAAAAEVKPSEASALAQEAGEVKTVAVKTEIKAAAAEMPSPVDKVLAKIKKQLTSIQKLQELTEEINEEASTVELILTTALPKLRDECDIDKPRDHIKVGHPPLCYAVRYGAENIIAKLINFGVKLDQVVVSPGFQSNGDTALVLAAYEGKIEIVRKLFLEGADPNLCNTKGGDALYWTLASGGITNDQKVAIFKIFFGTDRKGKLIAADRTYTVDNKEMALLELSVLDKSHAITEILLEQEGSIQFLNIHKQWKVDNDVENHTPFTYAVRMGDKRMVTIFLEKAASLLKPEVIADGIKWAIEAKNSDLTILILKNTKINEKLATIYLEILNFAVHCDLKDVVEYLIKLPNIDKCDFTRFRDKWLKSKTKAAEPLKDFVRQREFGPLGYAAYKNDVEKMKQLLNGEQKVDVNTLCPNGWSALAIAAHFGSDTAVNLLLEMKADVDQRVKKGDLEIESTALMQAVYYCQTKVVNALLEAGAKPELLDAEGYDALYWALALHPGSEARTEAQRLESIELLFKHIKAFKLDRTYRVSTDKKIKLPKKLRSGTAGTVPGRST